MPAVWSPGVAFAGTLMVKLSCTFEVGGRVTKFCSRVTHEPASFGFFSDGIRSKPPDCVLYASVA